MLTNISDDLKKIFLFGVGAMAITAEKSKILIDELVQKGEITVEQGKILNEELKHNIKETIREKVTVKSETAPTVETVVDGLDKMTPEDIQKIKDKLEAMSAEKTAEEEIVEVDVKEDVDAK